MFCPKCGTKNDGAKFCAKCGCELSENLNKSKQVNENNADAFVKNNKDNQNKTSKDKDKKNKFKKTNFSKKRVIISLCVIALIIFAISSCVIVYSVFIVPANNHKNLENNFNNSLNIAKKQKNDLENKIKGCESTLSNVHNNQVKDASTLLNLSDVLNTIKNEEQTITIDENIPATDDAIAEAIDDLTNKTEKLKDDWFKLNDTESKVYESKNAKSNEGIALTERMNVTGKDSNGYNIQTIVKSTSWIKASDKDMINRAWKSSGGRADAPTMSSFNKSNEPFNEDNSIVLVGSIEFHNKTDGFHISDTDKKNPEVKLTISDSSVKDYNSNFETESQNIFAKYAVGYSTGGGDNTEYGTLEKSYSSNGWSSLYKNLVRANMYKDDWGPVAFMVVLNNVFNPNHPNGNPLVNRLEFNFDPSYNKLGENNYIDSRLYKFKPQITW